MSALSKTPLSNFSATPGECTTLTDSANVARRLYNEWQGPATFSRDETRQKGIKVRVIRPKWPLDTPFTQIFNGLEDSDLLIRCPHTHTKHPGEISEHDEPESRV